MTLEKSAEVLGGRILDTRVKLLEGGHFVRHVYNDIAGQTLGAVCEPLDDIGILERNDPDGRALVVYLRVERIDRELRDIALFRQLTERSGRKSGRNALVKLRDVAEGLRVLLVYLIGEVAVGADIDYPAVSRGSEERTRDEIAYAHRKRDNADNNAGDYQLTLEIRHIFGSFEHVREQRRKQRIGRDDYRKKTVELICLEVEGRQHYIKCNGRSYQRAKHAQNYLERRFIGRYNYLLGAAFF